jgi:hypothetical protein
MKIIKRKQSLVVLRDKKGKYWLTRRKKLKRDSRRRRNNRACTVVYVPILQIDERELHLFMI